MRSSTATSSFAQSGTELAAFEPGAAPITLIDGDKLVELLTKYEIGVRTEPVKLWKFDPEAFEMPAEEGDEDGEGV